jgi:hypothetical protein
MLIIQPHGRVGCKWTGVLGCERDHGGVDKVNFNDRDYTGGRSTTDVVAHDIRR